MSGERPGARNAITDVAGLAVGSAEDRRAWTGTTVILPDAPSVAAADVRGGAPGTRETDLLDPAATVDRIDALVLSGGSVFGLDAAGALCEWLAARGRGFPVGGRVAPIVPAAIILDLLNGGDKDWQTPPYRGLAVAAAAAAGAEVALGNAGAGYGAKAATLKGGQGTASLVYDEAGGPVTVGALAIVNPNGSVAIPGSGAFWAWPLEIGVEFGGLAPPAARPAELGHDFRPGARENTTLVAVATDAALDKAQARRVAMMAQDGIARAIRPAHTPVDGDIVFALATARRGGALDPIALARLGMHAADCVARAIARAVYHAETLGRYPSWRETWGSGTDSRG